MGVKEDDWYRFVVGCRVEKVLLLIEEFREMLEWGLCGERGIRFFYWI